MAKACSEQIACIPGPGSNGQRVNYGLHENVVVRELPEAVRAKCQEVRLDQADILGLQGPKWHASTIVCSHKFQQSASDVRLSNTLRPKHINARDFRRTAGSTHTPTHRQISPTQERSLPSSHTQSHSAGWNISTEVSRRDILQGAEMVTQSSVRATQRRRNALLEKSTVRYASPEQRVAAQIAARVAALADYDDAHLQQLQALYGQEGAVAMQAIMQMPRYGNHVRHHPGKASRDDLLSVQQLPDDVTASCSPMPVEILKGAASTVHSEASKQSISVEGISAAGSAGANDLCPGKVPQKALLISCGTPHQGQQYALVGQSTVAQHKTALGPWLVDGWPVALPASALVPTAPSSQHGSVLKKGGQPSPATGAAREPDAVPKWISAMLGCSFFGPCEAHRALKKCEVRRYVYCDVIRALDINQYMDTAGVQSYIINQAKVMFLNPRHQSRLGTPASPDTCRVCARHLREGAAYCCLSCKVSALVSGDSWTPPAESPALSCGHHSAGSSSEAEADQATPLHHSTSNTAQRSPGMHPAASFDQLPHAPDMTSQPPHQAAAAAQLMAGLLPLLGRPADAFFPVGSSLEPVSDNSKSVPTQLPPPLPLDLTTQSPTSHCRRISHSPEAASVPFGGSLACMPTDFGHGLFVRSSSVAGSMGSIMTAAGVSGLVQSPAAMAAGASSPSLGTSRMPHMCVTDEESSHVARGVDGARDGAEADDERASEDEGDEGKASRKQRLPEETSPPNKRARTCKVIAAHHLAERPTSSSGSDIDELAPTPYMVPSSAGCSNPAGPGSPALAAAGTTRQLSAGINSRRKQNSPKKAAE